MVPSVDSAVKSGATSLILSDMNCLLWCAWYRPVHERHRCPCRTGKGTELVHAVGKAALEVRIERRGPLVHEPRPVVVLRTNQIGDSPLVRGMGWRHLSAFA